MQVHAVGRSVRGQVRAVNQDRFLVADLAHGAADVTQIEDHVFEVGPLDFSLGDAGAVLMVADGMGGRAAGERASEAAVSVVVSEMTGSPGPASGSVDFVQRLERALVRAHDAIHSEGMREEQYRGMGTTATLVGLLGRSAYVAQVGDSRAYLARNGTMIRLTRDQSLVQDLIDMGMLTEEEARDAPSSQVLQALGASPTVQPELTYHELRRDDVLLLCSDGLSRVVTDDEVRAVIASAGDCATLCEELIELANSRGGPDNITALVAHVGGDGIEAVGDDDVVARRSYRPPEG